MGVAAKNISLTGIAILLSACNPQVAQEKYRLLNGPAPELDTADVSGFVERQQKAVQNLAALAGYTSPPPPGSPAWNDVVDAGVLYVDRTCDRYIDALFWFDRSRDSAKSGLALTGAAVSAAMGILDAAASAIALTATGFGLATGLIDTGANTVLYSIEPSSIRTALGNAQQAYRGGIADRRYSNQAAALAAVQGYLALCLPATLETLVNTAVTTATIRETTTDRNSPIPPLQVNPGTTSPAALTRSTEPLPAPAQVTPSQGIVNPISPAERALLNGEGRRIQQALCVPPDGSFGPSTRAAIDLYRGERPRAASGAPGLNDAEVSELLGAGSCDANQFRNAYERFRLGKPAEIRALQDQLRELLQSSGVSVPQSGQFDAPTRDAIKAAERGFGLPETGTVTPTLADNLAI
jgi:peptidoglycan hydrolase-like protein with peptidoglycan-binding domain